MKQRDNKKADFMWPNCFFYFESKFVEKGITCNPWWANVCQSIAHIHIYLTRRAQTHTRHTVRWLVFLFLLSFNFTHKKEHFDFQTIIDNQPK